MNTEQKKYPGWAFLRPADWLPRRLDFGGWALIVFFLQAVSGLYLALFYQPTAAGAWSSIVSIENEVAGGGFFRSLHRWGAFSAAILLILHILHLIWSGAYRKPRTRTWFFGLLLLPLFAAFVVTGYLLPWDFRAYWITLNMGNWLDRLPLFAEILDFLLLSSPTLGGPVPVARWFVLHTAILPLLTAGTLAFHLVSLRHQTLVFTARGRLPVAGLLLLLGWLAVFGIQKQDFADPITTSPIPQPDWLFFMFFQASRYFQHNLEIIVVFWLPLAVTLCLFLLPWLDRGWGWWFKWSLVISSLSLALALAVLTHHTGTTTPIWSCQACHKEGFGKSFSRPPATVSEFSRRYDNKWLAMHYRYPQYFWMMDADAPGW